jgi:Family of unknown function (DUF5994)
MAASAPRTALSSGRALQRSHPLARLKLKPKAPVCGYVDGAWWPRSRNLSVELPALLRVLAVRLGPVERGRYHLSDWDSPTPRRINLDGTVVRLAGYRAPPRNTIDVLTRAQTLTLLVVAPQASVQDANRAMTAAGQRANTATADELLGLAPTGVEE